MELYILRDENGNEIDSGYFENRDAAIVKLPDEYRAYELVSENEVLAERYLPRIKAAKPALKKSGIVLDIDNAVFIRNGCTYEYYTFIPFTYYGKQRYCFRETASDEWVETLSSEG
ncbi:MAG: hypothetical protein Q4E94_06285 [Clostridia bacterium]|nr:hypothetical protein [Clostridia bacterium]